MHKIGPKDGRLDGRTVGELVLIKIDGDDDGLVDAMSDGFIVDTDVGDTDGFIDERVGENEGVRDGNNDGLSVSIDVGDADGFIDE